ncbi:MAG TPA: hypothetical protein VIR54_17540 [Vicinamibacterales bacterium]|jgi:hypothetical protein
MTRVVVTLALLAGAVLRIHAAPAPASAASAAELQNRTIQAFDRYVRLTEARLNGNASFLWIDTLPEAQRREAIHTVQRKELSIERVETKDNGREIDVPGGMIHHWVGTAFVQGVTINDALAVLQDYNEHHRIYAPTVAASKLRSRDGDRFTFFLRFVMKKVITVTVNSDHEAVFRRPAADRAEGWIHSTRIAEVENAGTSSEREKPVGDDGGYLWRLNTYWRLLARDGGLYIHCESVSLSRGIPIGFGWIVGPFVTSIPRESLTFTLETTRKRLERGTR